MTALLTARVHHDECAECGGRLEPTSFEDRCVCGERAADEALIHRCDYCEQPLIGGFCIACREPSFDHDEWGRPIQERAA